MPSLLASACAAVRRSSSDSSVAGATRTTRTVLRVLGFAFLLVGVPYFAWGVYTVFTYDGYDMPPGLAIGGFMGGLLMIGLGGILLNAGTIGAQARTWLEIGWPGRTAAIARSMMEQRPGLFRSTVYSLAEIRGEL